MCIASITAIAGTFADDNSSVGEEPYLSLNNSTNQSDLHENQTLNLTGSFLGNFSANMTANQTTGQIPADGNSNLTGAGYEAYSGIEHPNEATDVKSSTPSGDPFLGKYAQGGVSIDIGASLMEARGTDTNASSVISLRDHTSTFGYIKTIQKDFHYESKVDTNEES